MKRSVLPLVAALAATTTLAQVADLAEGEVRKVDNVAGKITLKHGEIKRHDMPAMTMAFPVKDKAMLDRVKAGDRVRFAVDKVGGVYRISEIHTIR